LSSSWKLSENPSIMQASCFTVPLSPSDSLPHCLNATLSHCIIVSRLHCSAASEFHCLTGSMSRFFTVHYLTASLSHFFFAL
jgi:hypothetical protein